MKNILKRFSVWWVCFCYGHTANPWSMQEIEAYEKFMRRGPRPIVRCKRCGKDLYI